MISDFQKLCVLPVAMLVFLFAVSTRTGMVWRGYQPPQIVAAAR